MDALQLYTSIVPSKRQLQLQELGFYAFFHFGLNTFANREWGDGRDLPSIFNPQKLDTDQWVRAVKAAGMGAVILTAKHHDGFCLWQTATTDYSIKHSPYKDGKGDIVKELSLSCKKYGLKMGLYLSPWDRNSKHYATERYNDFYIEQLTELLTNYGDIFAIWLDGACGSYLDGKPAQEYDFERIYKTIRELQPNCLIANCGPDVRWVGNEGGVTRESEFNVVPKALFTPESVAEKSQKSEDESMALKKALSHITEDLGSRKALEGYLELIWYPAEADVSIRPSWFYHKREDKRVKSVDTLMRLYFNTVGGNCLLLLNIPPNKDGLIAPPDERVLKALGDRLKSVFSKEVSIANMLAPPPKAGFEYIDKANHKSYSPSSCDKDYKIELSFLEPHLIDKLVIKEDTKYSQRIERFSLYTKKDEKHIKLYSGTTVGFGKFCVFRPTLCNNLILVIEECRLEPYLSELSAYESDGYKFKRDPMIKIKKAWHAYWNIKYTKRQLVKNKDAAKD
ncbi:MAG: alpha-L-fucosidase [Clostridia bacterium]